MNLQAIKQNDIQDELLTYLKNGGQPGLDVAFNCLNELYTHKQGGVTDWTGFPASGKTYFAMEILMGLSEQNGKRWGLYVPDIGSDKEVLQKLIKMRTGKDFNDKYYNKISESQLLKELNWIFHHFIIFKKKDFKGGVTPINFWEMVASYKDDGGKIDGGLADSWKNFKHIYAGREDLYLDETLSIRNEIAETEQIHLHTIAHAVKTELAEGEANKMKGKRRIPNAWDIKGGASWFANGKNIITVDFPDKSETFVDLHISKVKPEDVGKLGSVVKNLRLDLKRGRYYERIGTNIGYSYDWKNGNMQLDMNHKTAQSEIEAPPF